ncbi:LURP-one-related/scramblase family protein [Natronococcus wangiae]|uniref:LURP-one-related/scramblase family protein n=1 Tax=Natronococcus wangiae TaxID=3068275 RepID=UPI00273D77A0|nr:hypothetical protein [Natronococcus sp. AD5]
MATDDVVSGIDLSGDDYTVKQSLIRNKYNVYDGEGTLALTAKQKLFKLKEEFPFVDADGEPIFRIKAEGILDVAGDYTIVDEPSGEPIAVLEKNWTLLSHKWKVRSPTDERLLARIESRGAVVELIRNLPLVGLVTQFIPHAYTIESADGAQLGTIAGRLSFRDVYDITIDDEGDAPREALVAAAIAVDALEGN